MATLPQIVQFSQQPSPLLQGLGAVAQGAQAIGDARRRQEKEQQVANNRKAYELLGQAFSDESDDAMTSNLISKARELAPDLVFEVESMMRAQDAKRFRPDSQTAEQKNFRMYQKLLDEGRENDAKLFAQSAGITQREKPKELSSYLQKRLGESTDMAIESRSNASQFVGLADEIERANIGGGLIGGSWAETFKDLTGQQDAVTDLRKKYNAIKGSQVVKNLPPGAASDADIALALSGFPTGNASGAQIASFLRGVSKLENRQADFNEFKAQFISDNGTERGMLKAWRGLQKEEQQQTQEPKKSDENVKEAPRSAIDYLTKNPEMIDQFEAKYGYRPEGF